MATDAQTQWNGTGYAAQTVTKVPDWHGLVAWDLLFNNLTTGLFLTAALGDLLVPEVFTRVAKTAYPIALVLLFVDLLCLVLDLGDPLRFHHMLRVFKPTSPMSLGTWCLTIYSLPLTATAGLSLLPIASPTLEWTRKAFVILALLPALGSAIYKGVLLSTNAQPGWSSARWLGGYLANSAIMLGCAEMLVLAIVLGEERAGAILRTALGLLILLNVLVLSFLLVNLHTALSRMYTPRQLWLLGLLLLGGGVLVPVSLILVRASPPLLLSALVLLLLGSLGIRFMILKVPGALTDKKRR
jgi:hypothetical protein